MNLPRRWMSLSSANSANLIKVLQQETMGVIFITHDMGARRGVILAADSCAGDGQARPWKSRAELSDFPCADALIPKRYFGRRRPSAFGARCEATLCCHAVSR